MDLTDLEHLPGAPDQNFEVLTRAIVSRRYGALGTLRQRRNQPGVEFYLQIEHPGTRGAPGRVWGWSCKWFILKADNELTRGQRDQIEDSLAKAIKHVDGLSDFVLCLPQRPAKTDEEWIAALAHDGVSMHLWAAEEFEAEISGFDELRSTFFGELVLTPDSLARAHERSVAPIAARWVPPVHTSTDVGRRLERALLRPSAFAWLAEQAESIRVRAAALRDALADLDGSAARGIAEDAAEDLDRFAGELRDIADAARDLRPEEVRERIADQQPPTTSPRTLRRLVFESRKRHLPSALVVSGLAAEIRDAITWLQDTMTDVSAPLLAVVAPAGLGKTHLAAQLSAPAHGPVAGVFIQGGRLRVGDTLDDLARRIPGLRLQRFEDLLLALTSAGARAGARIPLIVDGLNEAERPSEWRSLLDELTPALSDYPNVLVVVTLREVLAARALPNSAVVLGLEWQEPEVHEILRTYFSYYLINVADAWLPIHLFYNPLFVRMYCEAANPQRLEPVGVETLPTSLIGVFELYRQAVTTRLANDPARVEVPEDQIRRRLADLALELWIRGARRLPSDDAKSSLDAGNPNWEESVFRRLEEEGVIFRDEAEGSNDTETGVLFDRFAGYLIADALLSQIPYGDIDERLGDDSLWNALAAEGGHPLAQDVTIGLVGLLPRRFSGRHLWRVSPGRRRKEVLTRELDSESEFLDEGTVTELQMLIASWEWTRPGLRGYGHWHPFDRLWEVRTAMDHRLNALFLDRVLRMLPVAERDRRWSEWTRYRASEVLVEDLNRHCRMWERDRSRSGDDDLAALSTVWLLTSTHTVLRDLATMALQRYGRTEPKRLFDLASRMLDVDDPYIVERLVGAALGAACAHQMPDPGGPFEHALGEWLIVLRSRFLSEASTSTSHELLRNYVRSTFELAGTLHPAAVPHDLNPFGLRFPEAPPAPLMLDDDPNANECARTFGMDFENYVIGAAIEDRRNYDFDHTPFRQARGEVMARVWDLGWRAALLGDIDHTIAEAGNRPGHERAKIERYGKKYGWIAYYEMIGRMCDAGHQPRRWVGGRRNVSPDIDPTFPEEPPPAPVQLPDWTLPDPADEVDWLRNGIVTVPDELQSPDGTDGVTGRWLLVAGHLEHRRCGRRVFGYFHTLLLEPADLHTAIELIGEVEYLGNRFPELPKITDVFGGEIPWSHRFEVHYDQDDSDSDPRPRLQRNWDDEGIEVMQVAVELSAGESGSPITLTRPYPVPSYDFADRFGLRQLPGTLDLVTLDGAQASTTFHAEEPWRGELLYIDRDLLQEFAGHRRIVLVAWGERQVTVDWQAVPPEVRNVLQSHQNVWRQIRVLDNEA